MIIKQAPYRDVSEVVSTESKHQASLVSALAVCCCEVGLLFRLAEFAGGLLPANQKMYFTSPYIVICVLIVCLKQPAFHSILYMSSDIGG